ncbi:class I SAM-dependent methyltransferase [Luteipulveratus sp. YIM 133132]|uniref:SAM-dependent methyltransferase n=1 Tax=Luteipulveratus flavus TaxID=3031728 RepID=UPI0023AE7A73|nr:class I SAM-dependent methyltransferase [Luteipulveratus sp. YIM 133132]MDE9365416.1 class I SAM-dependent methyltransferase [Luteipulveratus sp. YIM 133132]
MKQPTPGQTASEFWDELYGERDAVWSGRANPLLVRGAQDLTPGRALELGSGEGGDVIWLAQQGWQVLGVDVSATAIARAAGHVAEAGVADRVEWAQHDLATDFPEGEFDLVSAQFLHSPLEQEGERARILRRAAQAVAPGGVLLIGSHAAAAKPDGDEDDHAHDDYEFPTTAQMLEQLALPDSWQVELDEEVTSRFSWTDGREGLRTDSVLRIRRPRQDA